MENYQCDKCFERYENPVQCLNCKSKFCQKHINSDDSCPICKCYPFNFKDNTIINTSNINFDSNYKCNVCGFGTGDKNTFLRHIYDNHQDEIITYFNDNTIQNKDINQINKDQKISNVNPSSNMNSSSPNNNSINQIQNSNNKIIKESKNINLPTHRKSKYNQKSINSSQNKSTNNYNIKKIYYCRKKNELIKCECCPDHICEEGNCLCVNCMKINFDQNNLSENQLINKAGKVSEFYRGEFYCEQEYESIIKSFRQTYRNLRKCKHPYESCDDCKVLKKFRDIYNSFIK